MNIVVKTVKENKDGSATATITFDEEGLGFLIQEGLISLIKQAIEMDKNAKDGVRLRKKLAAKERVKK